MCSLDSRTVVLGVFRQCSNVPFKRHVHWLSAQTRITLLKGVMVKAVLHNVNGGRRATASGEWCPTEKQWEDHGCNTQHFKDVFRTAFVTLAIFSLPEAAQMFWKWSTLSLKQHFQLWCAERRGSLCSDVCLHSQLTSVRLPEFCDVVNCNQTELL